MVPEPPSSEPGTPVAKQAPVQQNSCSPKRDLSGKNTAAELLAAFSPLSQPKKDNQSSVISPSSFPIAMTTKRATRRKEPISYHISDDSDAQESQSVTDSTFSTPQKSRKVTSYEIIDLEDESESEPAKTPPPRVSTAGHALRQHGDLHLSLRAQENGDKQPIKRRRRRSKKVLRKPTIGHRAGPSTVPKTARNEIRNEIATQTAKKRANFFVAKKDYFLPLLPDKNHITRLAEERSEGQEGEKDLSVPYEAFEHQPKGYALSISLVQTSLICLQRESHHEAISIVRAVVPRIPEQKWPLRNIR